MTLLLMDSFEHEDAPGVLSKWRNAEPGLSTSPQTITGRNGHGVRLDVSSGVNGIIRNSADEHATMIMGFAFKHVNFPSNDTQLANFESDSSSLTHITIAMGTTGLIKAYRGTVSGGTLLGTTSDFIPLNTWKYIEIKVTLSDTVGVVNIRFDGASVLNLTSQDTKNAGTKTVIDSFAVGGAGLGSSSAGDDFYLCNGAGSVNNDFLGDIVVECLTPTSDGANTGLTPSTGSSHFALVDEIPQNTTDYNSSSVADTIDTYGMSNMATAAGTIAGVQVTNYAQKDISGLRKVAAVVRSGGTNYAGDDMPLGIGFLMYPDIWETDPATAAAWTIANVNAVEAGAKVR